MKFAFNLFISRRTSSVTGRTISSGTFSSGSSIADANGCRSSGLHDKGVTYKFDVEGGFVALLRTKSRATTRASPSISSKSVARTTPASLLGCRGRSVQLYISCSTLIVSHIRHRRGWVVVCEVIRDVFLSFGDLQRVRVRFEVDRSPCTAHFTADRTHA